MLTKLDKKQTELLEEVKDEWINFALFQGDDIDDKAVHEGIDFIYELSSLKKPIKIIVDSPLAVQYAIVFAKVLLKALNENIGGSQIDSRVFSQVYTQVYSEIRSRVDSRVFSQVRSQVLSQVPSRVYSQQVYSQVRSRVDSQVPSRVFSQVYTQVYSEIRSQVDSRVFSQVFSQVRSRVDSQVRSRVDSRVRSQGIKFEPFAYESLSWRAAWTAFFEYFKQIGIFKDEKWDKLVSYNKSGQFMGVYLDGLAVVCRRPQAVRQDDELRLHHDQRPAIEWRDGYKLFFIHGQPFEEKLWKKICSQKMTLKEVMEMKNADERTMAFSMLRPDRLLKGVNAKLIHTGIKDTKLYQVDNFTHVIGIAERPEGDTEYCMTMKDASSDRTFIEFVPPKIGKLGDADLCQANAFSISKELYLSLAGINEG